VQIETWGPGFGDIVGGPSADFLISERFRTVIEEHGLTGLEGFDRVNVRRVKRRGKRFKGDPPTYYRVTARRTQAAVDQKTSEVCWGDPDSVCPVCRKNGLLKRWKRAILEPDTWTGEDAFLARGLPATIFVTERFKEMCEKHELRNVIIVPGEDYGHDFYPQRSEAEERRVREILAMPLGPTVLQKVLRGNGVTWKYCVLSNELLMIAPDGEVQTYMKPDNGIEFYNLDL
jgi:hypothetical protein